MVYHICVYADQTHFFYEKYSRCQIPFYTRKQMRARYPQGDYITIGEVGNVREVSSGQDELSLTSDISIPIFPRGYMTKPFEWVEGYIALGENTYISAVGSLIPRRIICLKRFMPSIRKSRKTL